MDIQSIPLVSVSYNSAELVDELLRTFRQFYANPVTIIDGSSAEHAPAIAAVCAQYPNVKFIHFDYNIHHGPGMHGAYQNLDLQGPVLVLDSDVIVLKAGLVEALLAELKPGMYGVGYVNHVNEGGFDVTYEDGAVRYLHPACMLCNIEVVRQWPMPTKHGAPNIEPMLAIHRAGQHQLIQGIDWVKEDFSLTFEPKHYLRHDWQGTVKRTGGYHLEEWQRSVMEKQLQQQSTNPSPAAAPDEPTNYNRDLLPLIPPNARGVVEVGCNNGALARAYKAINPACKYTGIEVDAGNAEGSRRYCDEVLLMDIESVDESFYAKYADYNVWIFGDVLEHLRYPWEVLARIRRSMPADGCVIVCLPNAQHWSVQAKLAVGDFRYDAGGLMDRTHMRWFTRATMLEMFAGAGFKLEVGFPRIFGELKNEHIIAAIRSMAMGVGADPDLAVQDSLPMQYVVKAVPA
ncbi:methyltransferase domain-containing protein [Rhodoferax sp. AJA081-3]|uniref:methyltransferase domain-containing protein n=1 Tax=Rhodoferax sp. AJA081-3 TaxID=2752316 RepID=UPI001ADF36F5|nr:methyltransferase domain-containing protein [Rhodoferax sp. AJA081-3]QTN30248.1 methyltransferase domain-containing protein [Rhodoferax sp. AJA081-3]